jgi:hypothetical protein
MWKDIRRSVIGWAKGMFAARGFYRYQKKEFILIVKVRSPI